MPLLIRLKKEFFSSYTLGNNVKKGNNEEIEVFDIDTVYLETNNGSRLFINDVKHAPYIFLNLISTGKFNDEGYYSTFGSGLWKLTRDSMVVALR